MGSAIENGFTGFYIRPQIQIVNGKGIQRGVEIELLKDGEVVKRGKYEDIDEKSLEGLQKHLLAVSIYNLRVKKDLIDAIITARKNKEINVVNMFKIEVIKDNDNGTKDIRIVFLRNGYFFMQSTFVSVPEQRIKEIRNLLIDNIRHNMGCDVQCRSVTTLDLIAVIDNMLRRKCWYNTTPKKANRVFRLVIF